MNFDPVAYERKVYSQFEEDGVLLELVRRIDPPRKYFIEIGAGDGSENCTRILMDQGWGGEWIDASTANCRKAAQIASPRVAVTCGKATRENVRKLVTAPKSFGVLSIDVDGNDYWLWRELCGPLYPWRPAIVIIEAQIQRPSDEPYVMPYDSDYEWDNVSHDCGASIFSLVELGKTMGYHYIGKCSNLHSPNLFFVGREYVEKLSQ